MATDWGKVNIVTTPSGERMSYSDYTASLNPNNTKINPATGKPWSSGGYMDITSPTAKYEMTSTLIGMQAQADAGAYRNAENITNKIIAEATQTRKDIDQIYADMRADIIKMVEESATRQRSDIQNAYDLAGKEFETSISELSDIHQVAMGFFDKLEATGMADPYKRVSLVRGQLDSAFKQNFNEIKDWSQRTGAPISGAAVRKMQETSFKGIVPLVPEQMEKAYQSGMELTKGRVGEQQWYGGELGKVRTGIAGLEEQKGVNLANIERWKAGEGTGALTTEATGKAGAATTGLEAITSAQKSLIGSTPKADYTSLMNLVSGFQPGKGTTTTLINPPVSGSTYTTFYDPATKEYHTLDLSKQKPKENWMKV